MDNDLLETWLTLLDGVYDKSHHTSWKPTEYFDAYLAHDAVGNVIMASHDMLSMLRGDNHESSEG